jgi:hypothetical protein
MNLLVFFGLIYLAVNIPGMVSELGSVQRTTPEDLAKRELAFKARIECMIIREEYICQQ